MGKSQITIFIVLGIVILIIFGLVFFVIRQTSDIVLEKKINKIYSDFLSSTDIKYITQNCLDSTAKDALLLIGLQGGRLYSYQIDNGYTIPSFYDVIPFNYTLENLNGTIYNVSYGIKDVTSKWDNGPSIHSPGYPYEGSLVSDISKSLVDSSFLANSNNQVFAYVSTPGRFTILTDLCNRLGPNQYNIAGAGISCETYSPINKSIQEYVKQYIDQKIHSCINFTLKETSKYNISSGNLSSNVLIGENDLLISIIYPIRISIKNTPPVTKYENFNIRPKVRLKILHEIASHFIGYNPYIVPTKTEANNIFFNIEEDDPNDCYGGRSQCIIDGIKVFKLKDYCLNHNCNFDVAHYNYSDIFVIEDNKSIINGKPYRFQFAIENRKPALDFIDESVSPDKYYYQYMWEIYRKNLTETYSKIAGNPSSDEYNIIIGLDNLEIFPLGIDPDEDNLTYSYEVVVSSFGWTKATFHDSAYYNYSIHRRYGDSGIISDYNISKNANVVIGGGISSDNIVRINVSDNEGLYDYQDVKIRYINLFGFI